MMLQLWVKDRQMIEMTGRNRNGRFQFDKERPLMNKFGIVNILICMQTISLVT
jgi:hypothetical protein